ncbi:MAG: sugar phosphate nucleotidyltransferase [Erysipelotrichaceae bacterium]|nr:sugar phosphate nucleotidyltransferase [Erysipelotrichaceae bacterium]
MKPTLVILAAGMGSRYGGLKQIDAIGNNGEAIIDFTIFDAIEAGFKKVVFIIRQEHKDVFEKNLGSKIRHKIEVEYAFQDLHDIPEGCEVPEGREKPWGTTHALLAARHIIKDDPFIICNADDFYGKDSFKKVMNFFMESNDDNEYCMAGYKLSNTLSDNGTVTRGFCENTNGYLSGIREVMKIRKSLDGAEYEEGDTWVTCDPETPVSMNFWGFKPGIMSKMEVIFKEQFPEGVKNNPLKYEALLPNNVGDLVKRGECRVKVLTSEDSWFGVTYKEDKPSVVAKIQSFKDQGLYPFDLWK